MRNTRTVTLLTILMCLCPAVAARAQRADRNGDGTRLQQGNTAGTVVSLLSAPASGTGIETLIIQTSPGRTTTYLINSESRIAIPGMDDRAEMARQFVIRGVRATVQWRELLDERTGGRIGFLAANVTLESEWIEGEVVAVRKKRGDMSTVTVMATRRKELDPYERKPRGIDVRKRAAESDDAERPAAAEPVAQRLTISIDGASTEITAGGQPLDHTAFMSLSTPPKGAWKFQALIVNGPGFPVVSFHLADAVTVPKDKDAKKVKAKSDKN